MNATAKRTPAGPCLLLWRALLLRSVAARCGFMHATCRALKRAGY